MNALKTYFAPSASAYPANTAGTPANAQATRRYRERDFGIGYGTSSGYASVRRYANDRGAAILRFK